MRITSQSANTSILLQEAIQLATGFLLKDYDWVSPYYRDESLMLGIGWRPYEMMLQLLAKGDDPFTGGRAYYSHPNRRKKNYLRSPIKVVLPVCR